MKSIALYGNLIVDHVYCMDTFNVGASNDTSDYYSSIGAIGNMLKSIHVLCGEMLPDIRVYSQVGDDPTGTYVKDELLGQYNVNIDGVCGSIHYPTSSAVILSELCDQRRSSIVKWGACSNMTNFTPAKVDWAHFMYADTLLNLGSKHLSEIGRESTVSIDLCLSNHTEKNRDRILQLLPFVDYAFMSEEEARSIAGTGDLDGMNILEHLKKQCNGSIVIHEPGGSYYSYDPVKGSHETGLATYRTNEVDTTALNVLGAGDLFAAAFILGVMMQGLDTQKAVPFAHDKTGKLLRVRQDKTNVE